MQLLEDKRAAFANQKREYIIEHSIASKKKLAATRRTPIAKPKIHKAKQIYIPAPSQTPLHLQKSRWYATLSAEVVAPSIEVESPIITDSQIKKQSFHMEPIENEFPKMAFSSLDFNAVYPDSTVKPKVSTNENLEIVMQMAKMIVKTKSKATEDALAVEIEVKPAALIEDLTNLQQLILKGSRKAHIKYYQRPVLSIASIEDSSQSTIRSTLEINAVNPITKKESGSDIRQLKKSGSKSSLHSLRQRRGSSRYALDTNSSLGKRNGFSEQIIDEMPTSIIEQAVRPRSERKISPLCLADLSNQKELVPRTKAPNTFTFE